MMVQTEVDNNSLVTLMFKHLIEKKKKIPVDIGFLDLGSIHKLHLRQTSDREE